MPSEPSRPAGYSALIRRFNLAVMSNWHESVVGTGSTHRIETKSDHLHELFPAAYWPGDTVGDHLEFALKYDGINLQILAKLFAAAPQGAIAEYVRAKPTGKYARRVWYLYEFLTGARLPMEDISQGNYIDLLDHEKYYTSQGVAVQRQRIRDNLLGDARFCPIIRRTDLLQRFEKSGLAEQCRRLIEEVPVELLRRALGYLYTKESKSSFEIEHIRPNSTRTERFVALLQLAEKEDFFGKRALIELQNRIVDERFRDDGYRRSQNYVGETIAWQGERVHFVSPKPQDLDGLMDGMYVAHQRMTESSLQPVVHAAAVAYGFVFMHPFEDGNGRIHRFLIHNILSLRGFTPTGIMFPVSAVMLKQEAKYNASLEALSRPLMSLIDYVLDEQGRMTVRNETGDYYRYMDMTAQAEALFEFIRETIETELVQELTFLVNHDRAKHSVQEIVDMPDRMIDLFIRCCLQNHGRLSKRKREDTFQKLTDAEISKMESAVQEAYHPK